MPGNFIELRQRELMRVLVHELRNPVAAALYATELLNRNLSKLAERADDFSATARTIRAAVLGIESKLGHIARYARAGGDIAANCSLQQLLTFWQQASTLSPTCYQITDKSDTDGMIVGDVDRLAICLDALMQNAHAAQVAASTHEPINVTVRDDTSTNNQTIVTIRNRGVISMTPIEEVFTAFTTSDPARHLGLGLTLAKGIATDYAARIAVRTDSSHTEFDLMLSKVQRSKT